VKDEIAAEIQRRLATAARSCYPRAALRSRAEGVAKIRFCVGDDGLARDASIVVSSGLALLDDAALVCTLARAAPFPSGGGCNSVPIRFRLAQ
jgi:TonB family protein